VAAGEEVTMTKRFLATALLLAGAVPAPPVVTASMQGRANSAPAAGASARPTRIISLVPAVTEMIFAIGDGARVVAVSDYDRFPADVSRLPKVGGLLDPNVERILSLRPDLIVLYATQKELVQRLERGGIPYFSYEHRGLPDIMTTFRAIGARIGSASRADVVASEMDRSLAGIRATTSRLPHPATLLVFSRDPSSLRNVYASGGYGFLHDMLEIAGGTNVFGEIKRQSVQASTEMLITSRPDVIIELRYGDSLQQADIPKELQAWNVLGSVPAVRNHRVSALVGDEFVVPGPRVVEATRRLAGTLHPEAF
jgi:cobalamin transport system substrate-binding protein